MRVVGADHALPLRARRPDCLKVIDGIDEVSRRTCLKIAGSDGRTTPLRPMSKPQHSFGASSRAC